MRFDAVISIVPVIFLRFRWKLLGVLQGVFRGSCESLIGFSGSCWDLQGVFMIAVIV